MQLIHELAKQTGLPIATIRYYEQYGLFKGKKNPTVKSNNYTYYDADVLEKLELIREAKSIGFTLSEIKELIDVWHGKRISLDKKKEILRNKITQIEDKIRNLRQMKKLIIACMEDENL